MLGKAYLDLVDNFSHLPHVDLTARRAGDRIVVDTDGSRGVLYTFRLDRLNWQQKPSIWVVEAISGITRLSAVADANYFHLIGSRPGVVPGAREVERAGMLQNMIVQGFPLAIAFLEGNVLLGLEDQVSAAWVNSTRVF